MSYFSSKFNRAIRAPKRQSTAKVIGDWRKWLAALLPIVVDRLMNGEEVTIKALSEAVFGVGDARGLQYVGNVLGDGTKSKGLGLRKHPTPSRLRLVQENADLIARHLGEQELTVLLTGIGKTMTEYESWRDSLPIDDAAENELATKMPIVEELVVEPTANRPSETPIVNGEPYVSKTTDEIAAEIVAAFDEEIGHG